MLEGLKQKLQDNLIEMADQAYAQELALRQSPYQLWMKRTEGESADLVYSPERKGVAEGERRIHTEYRSMTCRVILIEEFTSPRLAMGSEEILVFASKNGELTEAFWKACERFTREPELDILYGDEDELTTEGRQNPWFKPDYAPDTLLSLQYLGACAIRYETLRQTYAATRDGAKIHDHEGEITYYELLLLLAEHCERLDATAMQYGNPQKHIVHVSQIFYHHYDRIADTFIRGTEEKYNEIKLAAILRRGASARMEQNRYGQYLPVYEVGPASPLVTIVIPSKDHPELLKTCIGSIRDKATYPNLEIIAIDNGSVGQNRVVIAELRQKLDFVLYYEPGEFNFSKMCNSGVKKAKGEYILFLNDDTTVQTGDFIERMLGQCSLPHVGAVGAKLLYPDGVHIQHAGVTNFATGPSHKLLGADNANSYYYGRNTLPYDMIGVTAACMMIRADLFREAGGFDETFKIAYNDVDLCFRLLEKGYYNVIRNDAELIHHESLSRGDDAKAASSWERLLSERESLYRKHPDFKDNDPFYHQNLSQEQLGFECRNAEEDGVILYTPALMPENEYRHLTENETLRVQIDYADVEQYHDLLNERENLWINGWAYVMGFDNARFTMQLIFKNTESEEIYSCPILRMIREDVIVTLPDEKNIELSGFQTCFHRDALPEGVYQIGMLARDKCSRLRLLRYTEVRLDLQKSSQ